MLLVRTPADYSLLRVRVGASTEEYHHPPRAVRTRAGQRTRSGRTILLPVAPFNCGHPSGCTWASGGLRPCTSLLYIFGDVTHPVFWSGVKRNSRSGPKTIFSGIWRAQKCPAAAMSVRRPQVREQGSRMVIWDHAHPIRNN